MYLCTCGETKDGMLGKRSFCDASSLALSLKRVRKDVATFPTCLGKREMPPLESPRAPRKKNRSGGDDKGLVWVPRVEKRDAAAALDLLPVAQCKRGRRDEAGSQQNLLVEAYRRIEAQESRLVALQARIRELEYMLGSQTAGIYNTTYNHGLLCY